jgi:hypothetical protein
MRIKPLFYFYLIVILLFAFDFTMWYRHQQVRTMARQITTASQQLNSLYKSKQTSPLERSLRIRTNAAHEQIRHHTKPWPIPDYFWNQVFLKAVFFVILPIVMLYLLWLHFRIPKKCPPRSAKK